ncbi:MAG: Asp-tRNA(Asn)/Glu-tRNA(Gln) amidotransferase subunit GatB, partial [Candidatus Pacebacteria bacterium]|nr:Asp-tRNA(Asn)/Glu-tRNA(Gln) amidotransferase subunit GatB [Candidatus Paceibacterota bacterium]
LSQYEFPLVSGGSLLGVDITRIHLEEDTARSSHTAESDHSLVDFNRGGVPLMELVTEPVLHSATDAANFARELQLLLRTLGASYANMEKGEMRVEANISVSKNKGVLGTKVEIKNLNSFKSVEKAIEFEVARHIKVLEEEGELVQETRGWDESKEITFSQRIKEEAADYRYFPEPDLPRMKLSEVEEFSVVNLRETLPELPMEKRERFRAQYKVPDEVIEMYVSDMLLGDFFEEVVKELASSENLEKKTLLASNYISNNLRALKVKPEEHVAQTLTTENFVGMLEMVYGGEISSNGAVEILRLLVSGDGEATARELAQDKGLLQQNDEGVLLEMVENILDENSDAVAEFKAGKEQALQYLVGQGMKLSKGSANPAKLKELITNKLV